MKVDHKFWLLGASQTGSNFINRFGDADFVSVIYRNFCQARSFQKLKVFDLAVKSPSKSNLGVLDA
jgi:hypothetical protein